MRIGIIGGSGLYDIDGIENVENRGIKTPFGSPSDSYVLGRLAGVDVCFLPRHGRGHRLLPSEINHKANIYGFKVLDCTRVLSISAVGSLREDMRPRDIVLPDQYFDRTKASLAHTFFGNGMVAHVAFGEPTCPELRAALAQAAKHATNADPASRDIRVFEKGTYVNMEGPAFSTKAESNTYRKLGFDVIGMTSLAEAKLCREAEICYQACAMVTDYDCWHESEQPVTLEMVLAVMNANVRLAKTLIRELLPILPKDSRCTCGNALQSALVTRKDLVPEETLKALWPLIARYMQD